jgi:hypothetical protein
MIGRLRRRRARRAAVAHDWCSVCLTDLRAGKVWEVRSGEQAADDGFGGTYWSQTFCRRHRPKGAVRS